MTSKKRVSSFIRLKPSLLFGLALPIILGGVALDYVSKLLARTFLKGPEIVELIPGIIRLHYVENTGAAFSMLEGRTMFFVVLTCVVLAFAVCVLLRGKLYGVPGVASLSFCIAGAIGNFIDRIRFGYVVDMFEPTFVNFAVFNVADIFLTLGGIALAIYIAFFHERYARHEELKLLSSEACAFFYTGNGRSLFAGLPSADKNEQR